MNYEMNKFLFITILDRNDRFSCMEMYEKKKIIILE